MSGSIDSLYPDLRTSAQRRFQFTTAAELTTHEDAEVPWLIPGLVASEAIVELAGHVKAGKSTFLLELAKSITSGKPFIGETPEITGPVIYLTEEGRVTFRSAIAQRGLSENPDIHCLFLNDHDVFSQGWKEIVDETLDVVIETGSVAVIIDPISAWTRLADEKENDAGATQAAMQPLRRITNTGAAVLYARHDRKGAGRTGELGRGSTAIAGFADDLFHLVEPNSASFLDERELDGKGRLIGIVNPITIRLTDSGYERAFNGRSSGRGRLEQLSLDLVSSSEEFILQADIATALRVPNNLTLTRALDKNYSSGVMLRKGGQGSNGRAYSYGSNLRVDSPTTTSD